MRLSDVQHQDEAQRRLQCALDAGRLPHAYLFIGPNGVGKEMLANRIAAVLLCADPTEVPAPNESDDCSRTWREACGRCDECVFFAAGNHPDFHRITRSLVRFHPDKKIQRRKETVLSVDVIRHFLIKRIGLRPGRGRAKVFIVPEADLLSNGAQNAMLKTLEEPPGRSYLILLAASADNLLPTTTSRCQQIAFRSLPAEFIRRHLTETEHADETAAAFLTEAAQGSLGTAVQFFHCGLSRTVPQVLAALGRAGADPLALSRLLQDQAKQMAENVAAANKAEGSEEVIETSATRMGQRMMLAVTATIIRDLQRMLIGRTPVAIPDSARLGQIVTQSHTEGVRAAIQAIAAAESHIRRNANAGLIFDALAVAIGKGLNPRMAVA